jgi:hypothetical protein
MGLDPIAAEWDYAQAERLERQRLRERLDQVAEQLREIDQALAEITVELRGGESLGR